MFRSTSQSSQSEDLAFPLSAAKRERLDAEWPGVFRREILPMLIEVEADFAELYSPSLGAPNKSVAVLLGILLLKEWHDYTDEQTLAAVGFNLQWQYALGLEPREAWICQKTLHNFRQRLLQSQRHQRLFEAVTRRIVDRFRVDVGRQRMDSTHVVGAMQLLTRLGLFVKTIENFLFKLRRMASKEGAIARLLDALPQKFHERYLQRAGYFADTRSSLAARRLEACAQDLWELLDRFRANPTLRQLKQYQQMQRLFREQCEVPSPSAAAAAAPGAELPGAVAVATGEAPLAAEVLEAVSDPLSQGEAPPTDGERPPGSLGTPLPEAAVAMKAPSTIAPTSLQNPSDPEATFGHKGKGYQMQLVETCGATNPFQVVTTYQLQGAHESDQTATLPLLETLDEQGLTPQEVSADSNYISGANIVGAQALGVTLLGPVRTSTGDPDRLTLADFTFDATAQHVVHCPAGQVPIRHQATRDQTGRSAYFERAVCEPCPLAAVCPTTINAIDRRLVWTPEALATAQRRQEQETPAFKEAYKIRSGIEATISHVKHDQGLGNLRVRGRTAIELVSCLKMLALNVKRAVTYVAQTLHQTHQAQIQAAQAALVGRVCRSWGLLTRFSARLSRWWASGDPVCWTYAR